MRLTAVPAIGAVNLTFTLPRHRRVSVRLAPGRSRSVHLPVCTTGTAHVTYRSNVRALVGLRAVSVKSTAPVFTPSQSACPAR